jgi:hypothetical protein
MATDLPIADAEIIKIVQAYYDAVDALDGDRLASAYHPASDTTLQFNADEPIVGSEAIAAFTRQFGMAVSKVEHTQIEVWKTPLMGDVVPVELAPGRPASTVTVVSTALPIFFIGEGADRKRLPVPATSIFTIDVASKKLISVHNMFDIGKVYAAVQG